MFIVNLQCWKVQTNVLSFLDVCLYMHLRFFTMRYNFRYFCNLDMCITLRKRWFSRFFIIAVKITFTYFIVDCLLTIFLLSDENGQTYLKCFQNGSRHLLFLNQKVSTWFFPDYKCLSRTMATCKESKSQLFSQISFLIGEGGICYKSRL